MTTARAFVSPGDETIVDADIDSSGRVVALIRDDARLSAVGPGWSFDVPLGIRFPEVRWLASDRILIFDTRGKGGAHNASVFSSDGVVSASFPAGDGIQDVVVIGSRIVIGYFDEGVFGGGPLSRQGLVVLNDEGQLAFGYHDQFSRDATFVGDVYAMCPEDERTIWFFPYTDFPLVRLDLVERTQTLHMVPDRLHGAHGICLTEDSVIFHSPYHERGALLAWSRVDGGVKKIGEYPGRLRGILGGRFLSVSEKEVSIFVPQTNAA